MKDIDSRARIVIMGAAGRDFHDFNTVYRDNPRFEVVAFTATQIPGIGGRCYPAELAGAGYPDGIPIVDEADLIGVCRRASVDQAVFAYSDVAHAIRGASPGSLAALGFEPGTMGLKIEAACDFVEKTAKTACIGALEDAVGIVDGEAGTAIRPSGELETYADQDMP